MTISPVAERRFQDKSTWGDGPWQNEPDKIHWIDEATDLDCLMVRNHWGAWCGYVGVPPGHALHEKTWGDCAIDHLSVHGGITYGDFCADGDQIDGVCHVPQPGRPHNVWWLGFDCAHHRDLMPGGPQSVITRGVFRSPDSFYRDVKYVVSEVESLAKQITVMWEEIGK